MGKIEYVEHILNQINNSFITSQEDSEEDCNGKRCCLCSEFSCTSRAESCELDIDTELMEKRNYRNDFQERNYTNVANSQYNCGGFALNTFNWYAPKHDAINLDEYKQLINMSVNDMIETFEGDLRVVNNLADIKIDEYAILFRYEMNLDPNSIYNDLCDNCQNEDCLDCDCFVDHDIDDYHGDFHFVREFNGIWLHKPGGCEICEIPENEIFNNWSSMHSIGRYKGEIIIMAMKNSRDMLLQLMT